VVFDQRIALALRCRGPIAHVWRGRWLGPPAKLQLDFSGAATVDTAAGRVLDRQGWEAHGDFAVTPQTDVIVTLTTAGPDSAVHATLLERTPAGQRVPPWEHVAPVFAAGAGGPPPAVP
jgi:hypothetical protein